MNLLNNLIRKTNNKNFIPEIDGLRFVAIFTVLIFHLNSTLANKFGYAEYGIHQLGGSDSIFCLGWWVIRLDLGVKLFFSISGFILSVPFIKASQSKTKIDIADYFKRRLLRLEPPFVISMLFFLLVHQVILDSPITNIYTHFFTGLFYTHGLVFGYANPINPVTWSLEVESQFYLLIPMFFLLVFSFKSQFTRNGVLGLFFVAGIVFKFILANAGYNHLYASVLYFIPNFMVGIFIAFIYLHSPMNWWKKRKMYWDFIGFISFFLMFYFYKPQADLSNMLWFNISMFMFFVSAFKSIILNSILRYKIIYIIGGMCYSIYLLHYAMLHIIVDFTSQIYIKDYISLLSIQLVICIPIVIIGSAIFFVVIEKPCMDKNWPVNLKTSLVRLFKRRID